MEYKNQTENLALLSERGEILKLSYEGGADHYDA